MNKKLKEAFVHSKEEPDIGLSLSVWNNILIHNKKVVYFKIGSFSLLGILSLVSIIPAFVTLSNGFSKSGFYEYFSLLFSNNGNLASYWKELGLSLAESLPVVEIMYALLLILVLFVSLRYVAKQIIKNQLVLSI